MKDNLKKMGTCLATFLLVWVVNQPIYALGLPNNNVFSQSAVTVSGPSAQPLITPTPPSLHAKGYVLMDANNGHIIAEKNPNLRLAPASLTKMMTMYIISSALKSGRIHLDDKVTISKKAWRMKGSKMFVRVGNKVPVSDLIRGIIIASGNDACVAMSEYIAGSEKDFVSLMNQQAKLLGMQHTHFSDCTGFPHADHYSTPHDLAVLARALILDFPQYYKNWYAQKWFTWDGIKQANRNKLLWRDTWVDGVKTGHTKDAGYCLVASGIQKGMRLISVVMGTPSNMARAEESQKLLQYGFRFFENHELYQANTTLSSPRVWMGRYKTVPIGVNKSIIVTIPSGAYNRLHATMDLQNVVRAPVSKGTVLGNLSVTLGKKVLASEPLVALTNDPKGSVWVRLKDYISLSFYKLWHKHDNDTGSGAPRQLAKSDHATSKKG